MFETSLLTIGLAFLVPLGYALIAVAGLDEGRARHAALSALAALGLAVLGYVAAGFALEFGGVGLAHALPGLEGLVWEWSGTVLRAINISLGLGKHRKGGRWL